MNEFEKLPFYNPAIKSMTYAGIGSRKVPNVVKATMTSISDSLDKAGYTLYSGGAEGSDKAFEWGAGKKQIFLASHANDLSLKIANEIHPSPFSLSWYAKMLMARNTFQIFGPELNSCVDFVVCWTEDGCESFKDRTIKTGGTGQAIEMASRKGIPVFNLSNGNCLERLSLFLGINFI